MVKATKQVILLLALWLTAGAMHLMKADGVTFRASAPSAVVMGQQFQLTYTVNTEGATSLRTPDLSAFEVLMGPSSSVSRSMQIINGQTSSSYSQTFTYVLMPKKEGTFNIGPGSIKIKNANYSSNSLVVKVLPPDKAGSASGGGRSSGGSGSGGASQGSTSVGTNELFVRMNVSNRSIYEQEGFLVTFKIYSLYDVDLDDIKFPEFEGFLAQDIDLNPQWTLENYNGRNYRTAVFKQTILYPQRSGKITIGAGRFNAIAHVRVKRSGSLFDELMGGGYQDIRKVLTTAPVTVDVKPLPSGKPESFNGAVGGYTMKATINSNQAKTNEAVTITVTLTGNGNIKLAKNPTVTFPNDFEVYDPKVETNIRTTTSGSSGTKTIEYIAVPRYAGDFEIPAIHFSYFDPRSGSYKTLTSEPFKLHVEKGPEGAASPAVSNYGSQESVKYLSKDIRYIKTSRPHFVNARGEIFFGSFTYVLAYVLIALLFAVFFVIYRKQMKENADLAFVRTKRANKVALRRLKTAEKLMKAGSREAFYDEISRTLWGYLSDKLNIPQADLTRENVGNELASFGADETLAKDLMQILDTCEFARYAPSQASDALDTLYRQTADAIGRMENIIKH
ncbi:BatD protein [Tannerella sp. oral taxon 808]|nr:BatD protein [Tannerella sp. oral taxon 808]